MWFAQDPTQRFEILLYHRRRNQIVELLLAYTPQDTLLIPSEVSRMIRRSNFYHVGSPSILVKNCLRVNLVRKVFMMNWICWEIFS